jgi:hypothetical protein
MRKSPGKAMWNSCGCNNAFWSRSCALAASICGCSVASSRRSWSDQSSWAALRIVQPSARLIVLHQSSLGIWLWGVGGEKGRSDTCHLGSQIT